MAYKRITLKDPVTGDFLIPSTGGLEYIPTPDGVVPPFELIKDADTLQGHTADEFVKLSEVNFNGIGNEYVWAKEEYVEKLSTISDTYIADCDNLSTYIVRYSSEISISSSGSVSMINPQDAQFKAGSSDVSMLAGKYYYKTTGNNVIDTSNIRKIPENATIKWSNGRSIYVQSTPVYTVSSELQPVCYVNSPDPNAYPPAVSDGYTYTPLGQLGDNLKGDTLKTVTGSYVGTGTYGRGNLTTLTFDFSPKFVFIIAKLNVQYTFVFTGSSTKANSIFAGSMQTHNLEWTNGGKTVSWYGVGASSALGSTSVTAEAQMNENGIEYLYLVIV